MNSSVCDYKRIHLYLVFAMMLVSTVINFHSGGRALARHHQYHNEELGKLLHMHIHAKKDFFGARRFSLFEDYNIAEHGFNCSISKDYDHRSGAERAMKRHAAGHATLSLHFHGSSCMKHKDWTRLRAEADDGFTFGSIMLVVALFFLVGCVTYERERCHKRRHFAAIVPTAEEEVKESSSCDDVSATLV
jgi:hypothetical protein